MNLTDKEWKELRKLLNKAWDEGHWSGVYQPWTQYQPSKRNARYRDVSKILKEAQAVDWSKLSKPDNVEQTDE